MPDGTPPIRRDVGSNSTERLNSAIERMLAGGPAPVLNDPDLHDLLQLATRLRHELPNDLPDPAFRLGLKQQLTASGPVALPRTRAAAPTRFPWVAAVSAMAAVLLAAVSVGTLGIWLGNNSGGPSNDSNLAGVSSDQLTATTLGFATTTVNAIPGDPATIPTATAPGDPSSMTTIQPSAEPTESVEPSNATEPATEPAATQSAPATLTTEPAPTAQQTEGPSLAAVPPVDDEHVEQGPRPAADGGGGSPATDVSYVLNTSMPDLVDDATVYRFAPPATDPDEFVVKISDALGLQGDIVIDEPTGQTVYHLFDDDTGSFHWTPDTGAFTVALTQTGDGAPLQFEQLVVTARDWLAGIDYPVDLLEPEMSAEPTGDTSWRLEARYAAMPDIGLGHPLGVTIYINADGTVTEASGYWLNLKASESALLLSAADIWKTVSSGQGYWTGGGIVEAGGAFSADSMQITYILTRDPSGELVLQPVVETSGEFITADGLSSARISCFVQAVQTAEDTTP